MLICSKPAYARASFHPELHQRILKQSLIKPGERDPYISGMSYNSAGDELFFADYNNKVVRMIRLRDNSFDLCDVYKVEGFSEVWSVCHMSDSDTLLVCSQTNTDQSQYQNWLVALSRSGNIWLEKHPMQIETQDNRFSPIILCALLDSRHSRVLIGHYRSKYMELFQVERGPSIARINRIIITQMYYWFSATSGTDTLVAISYINEVRVHRLRGDRLEVLARIKMERPSDLLLLDDRLFTEQLFAPNHKIWVRKWCAVDGELAIFEWNSKDILYNFKSGL